MVLIRWLRFDCRNDFLLFFSLEELSHDETNQEIDPNKEDNQSNRYIDDLKRNTSSCLHAKSADLQNTEQNRW